MAKRRDNRWVVWIMVGLIVVGFGGWFSRGGSIRATALGTVGGLEVPIQDYVNGVRNQMRSISQQAGQEMTFAQAQQLGVDRQVLAQVVTQRVLDAEAQRLGLSVGDEQVAQQVFAIQAFQGLDGKFDRDAYREALRRNGMTEESFETSLRDEKTRQILQAAVTSGVPQATTYGEVLAAYSNERRTVTWARLGTDTVAVAPEPTEDDLKAWYDAHPEQFTTPETRQISYAWITPEIIQDQMPVDDQAVRDLYDQRKDQYVQEERRLVERLVYPTAEAAEAAKASLDSGAKTFEQLVEDRGLLLSDTDLGDMSKAQLGAAGDAVFGAATGDVVGPLDTDLGPALFRINAVLAADTTPFEEAAPDLKAELAQEKARDTIREIEPKLQDLLAGGATIADIDAQTDLTAGQIAWAEGSAEGIAAYEPFRTAAASLTEGADPQVVELGDGGVAVLKLDGVTAPVLRSFEESRDQAKAAWQAKAVEDAVVAKAAEMATAIASGASFEDQGLAPQTAERISRRDPVEGTSADFVKTVFGLAQGAATSIPADGGAIVVRLDAVEPAKPDDPSVSAESTAIAQQVSQSLAQDLFDAFAATLQSGTEVRIDDATVAAVNNQIN